MYVFLFKQAMGCFQKPHFFDEKFLRSFCFPAGGLRESAGGKQKDYKE